MDEWDIIINDVLFNTFRKIIGKFEKTSKSELNKQQRTFKNKYTYNNPNTTIEINLNFN